ncbi:hypothetical protein RHECNPAF_1260078 [Rhizobium etli CNPAF512]|nr:hypothetical protein RHECNPAF_1260078 [Rhizobium etli CNPAF512]
MRDGIQCCPHRSLPNVKRSSTIPVLRAFRQ